MALNAYLRAKRLDFLNAVLVCSTTLIMTALKHYPPPRKHTPGFAPNRI